MSTPRSLAQQHGVRGVDAVLIGGSAGAFEVVVRLLESLPDALTAPVVIVLHQLRRRPSTLAQALSDCCRRPLREAEDKEPLADSTVYVAPADYHLLIERGPAFALSVDAPVHFSLPSIDVLFESAAAALAPRLCAIVLSGANEDGAAGLRSVQQAGGTAIIQSPSDAASRALPEAALAACPGALVLPSSGIRERLHALAAAPPAARGGA
jgi:two-component system chemotaxis response regulator CheB